MARMTFVCTWPDQCKALGLCRFHDAGLTACSPYPGDAHYPMPAIRYKVRHYRGKAIDIASYKPKAPWIDRWWDAKP